MSGNRAVSEFDAQADPDPVETREWIDALTAVAKFSGGARAEFLLRQLEDEGRRRSIFKTVQPYSSYRNTIPLQTKASIPEISRSRSG